MNNLTELAVQMAMQINGAECSGDEIRTEVTKQHAGSAVPSPISECRSSKVSIPNR
jgi:hypothetical protein